MNTVRRVLAVLVTLAVLIVTKLADSGATVAIVLYLRWWAFPALFGIGMLLSGFVFLALMPSGSQKKPPEWFNRLRDRFRRRFPKAYQRMSDWLRRTQARFSEGIWLKLRKIGPFTLVIAVALVFGPFFAALVIRFLGLPDQKAWSYAFIGTVVTTAFWVSFYLGALDGVKSFFISLL